MWSESVSHSRERCQSTEQRGDESHLTEKKGSPFICADGVNELHPRPDPQVASYPNDCESSPHLNSNP